MYKSTFDFIMSDTVILPRFQYSTMKIVINLNKSSENDHLYELNRVHKFTSISAKLNH